MSVKTSSLTLSKNIPHNSFFLNFPQNITRSPCERNRMYRCESLCIFSSSSWLRGASSPPSPLGFEEASGGGGGWMTSRGTRGAGGGGDFVQIAPVYGGEKRVRANDVVVDTAVSTNS